MGTGAQGADAADPREVPLAAEVEVPGAADGGEAQADVTGGGRR